MRLDCHDGLTTGRVAVQAKALEWVTVGTQGQDVQVAGSTAAMQPVGDPPNDFAIQAVLFGAPCRTSMWRWDA